MKFDQSPTTEENSSSVFYGSLNFMNFFLDTCLDQVTFLLKKKNSKCQKES